MYYYDYCFCCFCYCYWLWFEHSLAVGRKEGHFYLMMHSTHFIMVTWHPTYGYMMSEIWLHGVRHMVKDYWGGKRGNPLLQLHEQGFFYIAYTMTLFMEHWLEWEIVQWVHHKGLIQRPIPPWVDALPESYISHTLPAASFLSQYMSGPLPYDQNHKIICVECIIK